MILTIVPSYKNITCLLLLVLLLMLHTRNNTDGNKLMIFSNVALCYGDTCYYHTSNSCKCMGVNEEALQLHAVHKKLYFFTTSHARMYMCKRNIKLHATM